MRLRIIQGVVPLLLSVLALIAVGHVVDIRKSAATLMALPPATLILTLVMIGLAYAVVGLRFAWFMERITPMRFDDAVRLNFALVFSAHALGFVSDAIRIRYLMRRYSLALDAAISASIADRLLSTWILAWGLLLLLPFVPHTTLMLVGFTALLVSLTAGLLLARCTFWPAWIRAPLSVFVGSIRDRRVLWRQVTMQVSVVAVVGVTLWVLGHAMGAELSPLLAIAFAPAVLLAASTPFTYAGLGAREAVFALALPMLARVTPESAVALSLGLGSCFLVGSLPGALTLAPILVAHPLSKEE